MGILVYHTKEKIYQNGSVKFGSEVRSITSPASALLASSYQTNKGVGFPRPNQAGCLGNLIRYMLKLSRVTSSCCYSHHQLIVVVEFRCFIEDFILLVNCF